MTLAATFEAKLSYLFDPLRRLWDELQATPDEFVLYGGSAIVLRLGHRQSPGFDFFSNRPFAPRELLGRVPYLRSETLSQAEPNRLVCVLDRGGPARVTFSGGLKLGRVEDPGVPAGAKVHVASALDLAASKLWAILHRARHADYFDLHALLDSGVDLGKALAAACALYGEACCPERCVEALTRFDRGEVAQTAPEIRRRLTAMAAAVDLTRLPAVQVKQGLQ